MPTPISYVAKPGRSSKQRRVSVGAGGLSLRADMVKHHMQNPGWEVQATAAQQDGRPAPRGLDPGDAPFVSGTSGRSGLKEQS